MSSHKLRKTKQGHEDEDDRSDTAYKVGERVLCYEPDPLKCKVLYDAKVLKIAKCKGDSGMIQFQYLIHFQGWNSSWDRYVADDLIMKDTEENRELQAELNDAVNSQLKKGKQKMKVHTTGICETPLRKTKPESWSVSRDEYGFMRLENIEDSIEEGEWHDSANEFNICVSVSEEFNNLLEMDYEFIHDESKLPVLPAPINIIQILIKFVKSRGMRMLERWYKKYQWEIATARAAKEAGDYATFRHYKATLPSPSSRDQTPEELINILCDMERMKAFAADVAIMFDWYVGLMLLYPQEKLRYENCLQTDPTFQTSFTWNIDIPEDLQFTADDLSGKMRPESSVSASPKTKLPRSHPSNRYYDFLPRYAGTSKSDMADDKRERAIEIHCRRRIHKHVKSLVDWTLNAGTNARPSLIYGLPHLLRLILKSPIIFAKLDMPRFRIDKLACFMNSLLAFILEEYNAEHMVYETVDRPPILIDLEPEPSTSAPK